MKQLLEDYLREWGFTPQRVWWLEVGLTLLGVAVALWVVQLVVRFVRGLRPVVLHPKLQKYGGEDDPEAQRRRELAGRVLSTSSTPQVPGYRIVQAVEALYVDGFRTPGEALEGLKASAAEHGANALINVRHERSSLGRCAASGDAVVVESLAPRPAPPGAPQPPTPPRPAKRGGEPGGPMIR